jgi:hypothetical protein
MILVGISARIALRDIQDRLSPIVPVSESDGDEGLIQDEHRTSALDKIKP